MSTYFHAGTVIRKGEGLDMSGRMSEKEKMYFFVLLFPPLWPLGLAMLMCDIGEAIGRNARRLYRRLRNAPMPDHQSAIASHENGSSPQS